ncbi:MAG TPA: hypothetical protein VHF27_01000 [Acidimicrobiales bacterium]|nr:hypothetical protein [Acidimicrobiales bacterium]
MGNALLALALPLVLVEALPIIRSLERVKAAARDIARPVPSVSATVPPASPAGSAGTGPWPRGRRPGT